MSSGSVRLDGVRALRTRDARDRSGTFFAEGVRFLVSALDADAPVVATVVAPKLLTSVIGQMLVRRSRARGVPELRVSPDEYRSLTTSTEPQGVGVVVRQTWTRFADAPPKEDACWLAVAEVRSPGNLGTLLRTCEASGATGIVVVGRKVDPFDPGCVRASMGALFSRRIVRTDLPGLESFARRTGALVVGATADAPHDYRTIAYRRPVVVMLGSERKGLRPEHLAACEVTVAIPMCGRTDSLNLAVAGSVLLYEIRNQRHPVTVSGARGGSKA